MHVRFRALFGVIALALPCALNAEFDHTLWDGLLKKHVVELQGGKATQVDYAAMGVDRQILENYLSLTSRVRKQDFDAWPLAEQLAFLVNVYNAHTVNLVLSEYPAIDSIKEIGSWFQSPWRQPIASLFGNQVSLDEIEHDMIRGWDRYLEPRIHFVVNCAAIGCPPLRAEAYIGARLQQQLDDSTRLFLSDSERNYVQGTRVYISKIFDWYAEDFEQGWQGFNSVQEFLASYAEALQIDPQQANSLKGNGFSVRYLTYDWGLNRLP